MKKGQFSRDWSLLKLARTWEPRDIGGEVIERVMREGTPETVMDLLRVVSAIGFEDGEKACERMPPFMQPAEIIESTLLVAGVEMEREEGEDGENRNGGHDGKKGNKGDTGNDGDDEEKGLVIVVNLDAPGLFSYPFSMAEPAAAYITGFVQAVAGGATAVRSENHLRIQL